MKKQAKQLKVCVSLETIRKCEKGTASWKVTGNDRTDKYSGKSHAGFRFSSDALACEALDVRARSVKGVRKAERLPRRMTLRAL